MRCHLESRYSKALYYFDAEEKSFWHLVTCHPVWAAAFGLAIFCFGLMLADIWVKYGTEILLTGLFAVLIYVDVRAWKWAISSTRKNNGLTK